MFIQNPVSGVWIQGPKNLGSRILTIGKIQDGGEKEVDISRSAK
jgi:hypothetical protein